MSATTVPIDTTKMETHEMLRLYHETKDEQLKWEIVLRYEELVKRVAMQIRGVYAGFADIEDIISEGLITISKAIDKFDPDKGVKFETYVSKRIRGVVIDLARQQDWMPRNIRKRAKEFDEATTTLANQLGRFPTSAEMAEHLNITPERYHKDVAAISVNNVLSLDALMDARDNGANQFQMPSDDFDASPEAVLEEGELRDVLSRCISELQENEQLVLSLYYVENLHLKDIAHVMGVSEPRTSQLHTRAIGKLRTKMMEYFRM